MPPSVPNMSHQGRGGDSDPAGIGFLPPGLTPDTNETKGTITISLLAQIGPWGSSLCFKLHWWGDVNPALLPFQYHTSLTYSLLTSEERFQDYLRDASPLRITIHNQGEENTEVWGEALVTRLEQVWKGQRSDVPIVSPRNGEKLGSIDLRMEFKSVEEEEKEREVDQFNRQQKENKKAAGNRKKEPKQHAKATSGTGKVVLRSKKPSPASNDENFNPVPSQPSEENRPNTPSENESALREINDRLIRKQEELLRELTREEEKQAKLREDAKQAMKRRSKNPSPPSSLAPPHQPSSSSAPLSNDREPTLDLTPSEQHFVPGTKPIWSLTESQLRWLAQVTQVRFQVKRLYLHPALQAKFQGRKEQNKLSANYGRVPQPKSRAFFIQTKLPGVKEGVSFCSRHVQKDGRTVTFEDSETQSCDLVFTAKLLDSWWKGEVKLSVHSRQLGQRVPEKLGESRLALKHILMRQEVDYKMSSGLQVFKLPVYASQNLIREMGPKFKSEIVADLSVTFQLVANFGRGEEKGKNLSPEIPLEIQGYSNRKEDVAPTKGAPRQKEKPILNQETFNRPLQSRSVNNRPQMRTPTSPFNANSPSNVDNQLSTEPIFLFLRIPSGRNFALQGTNGRSSPMAPNLLVRSRLFSRHETVSSEVKWQTTEPKFMLQHYIKIDLDRRTFLQRVKENYLVIEVWNQSEESDSESVVGVAMVPLHQFYLAFCKTSPSDHHDLAVIASNAWLPVTDMETGSERGQVKVLLALGEEEQIQRLIMNEDNVRSPTRHVAQRQQEHHHRSPTHHVAQRQRQQHHQNHQQQQEHEEPPQDHPSVQEVSNNSASSDPDHIYDVVEGSSSSSSDEGPRQQVQENKSCMKRHKSYTVLPKENNRFPESFRACVEVFEGRNLPGVCSKASRSKRVPPSARVSFAVAHGDGQDEDESGCRVVWTDRVEDTRNPHWNFHSSVSLPSCLLTDPRRQLILKVWHKEKQQQQQQQRSEDDSEEESYILGFAAVDLATLNTGFPQVTGWYTITDFVGKPRGQIRVSVRPLQSLRAFQAGEEDGVLRRDSCYFTQDLGFPSRHTPVAKERVEQSHQAKQSAQPYVDPTSDYCDLQNTDNQQPSIVSSCSLPADNNNLDEPNWRLDSEPNWRLPSRHVEEDPTKSLLERKLSDLDAFLKPLANPELASSRSILEISDDEEEIAPHNTSKGLLRDTEGEERRPLQDAPLSELHDNVMRSLQLLRENCGTNPNEEDSFHFGNDELNGI